MKQCNGHARLPLLTQATTLTAHNESLVEAIILIWSVMRVPPSGKTMDPLLDICWPNALADTVCALQLHATTKRQALPKFFIANLNYNLFILNFDFFSKLLFSVLTSGTGVVCPTKCGELLLSKSVQDNKCCTKLAAESRIVPSGRRRFGAHRN